MIRCAHPFGAIVASSDVRRFARLEPAGLLTLQYDAIEQDEGVESEMVLKNVMWRAWRDSNPRPIGSEPTTLSS